MDHHTSGSDKGLSLGGSELAFDLYSTCAYSCSRICGNLFKRETVAELSLASISGTLAGLFFLGTGASYIFQMFMALSKISYSPEIFITLILILASTGLGVAAIAFSLKDKRYGTGSIRKRLYFFILGIIGLLLWAGLFIGPLLAFEAALLPGNVKNKV